MLLHSGEQRTGEESPEIRPLQPSGSLPQTSHVYRHNYCTCQDIASYKIKMQSYLWTGSYGTVRVIVDIYRTIWHVRAVPM